MKKAKKGKTKPMPKGSPKREKVKETSNDEINKLFKLDPDLIRQEKEENAEKFTKFIEKTGIKKAFGLILNEIIQKDIPQEEFYDFVQTRLKELSLEYRKFIAKKRPSKQVRDVRALR